MNAPLQPVMPYPMTFGQILDRIFRLMRSQLKLFIGIASVPAVAMFLMMILLFAIAFIPIFSQLPKQPDPAMVLRVFLPAMLFTIPLHLAVFALYLAASIHAAMQANLGIPITFREAYGTAWKRGWRYFWLLFLSYIIAFLPMLVIELVMIVPMQLFAMGKSGPMTPFVYMIPLAMLLFIAALVYGVIITMRLSLAFPASLAEDLTACVALRRSGQLTRGAKGRIFLILLVIYALGYAAEMAGFFVLAAIFGISALILMALHGTLASVAGIAAAALAVMCFFAFIFLWIALFWAAFSTAIAVFYHDQRLRIDGPPPAPTAIVEGRA